MIGPFPSQVVRVVSVMLAPFIMVFGVYVTVQGHYGPGGGFAGGVIVAVGIILLRITVDPQASQRVFPARASLIVGSSGMLLFLACGLVPVFFGGQFLDYGQVTSPWLSVAETRYLAILLVEIAVMATVFAAMVLIFDVLMKEDR